MYIQRTILDKSNVKEILFISMLIMKETELELIKIRKINETKKIRNKLKANFHKQTLIKEKKKKEKREMKYKQNDEEERNCISLL